jgi:ATPase subunit of ABC transporter with duplicated ATPase domains
MEHEFTRCRAWWSSPLQRLTGGLAGTAAFGGFVSSDQSRMRAHPITSDTEECDRGRWPNPGVRAKCQDPPNTALDVEGLSVRFGPDQVLTDLTFAIARGSALAITGPNGAGKSVLISALLGSIPTEGLIRWAPGTRIGYMPQKLDVPQ